MSTVTSFSPTAWVLNLEADDELAHPGPFTPKAAARALIESRAAQLLLQLGPGAVRVDRNTVAGSLVGAAGFAWCPTPSALRLLAHAGAHPPADVPRVDVLRRVNHRRFCAELGQGLPEALYAEDADTVARHVARPGPSGAWVLKRPFGYTGRGRLLHPAGALSPAERAWLEASVRAWGGVQVEPWVERRGDFGLHGYVKTNGVTLYGEATVQVCDAHGTWLKSERAPAGALTLAEEALLRQSAEHTAKALRAAGYAGPFGIDAFRWADTTGQTHFQPRCEVNARYSMGWFVGMGGVAKP